MVILTDVIMMILDMHTSAYVVWVFKRKWKSKTKRNGYSNIILENKEFCSYLFVRFGIIKYFAYISFICYYALMQCDPENLATKDLGHRIVSSKKEKW